MGSGNSRASHERSESYASSRRILKSERHAFATCRGGSVFNGVPRTVRSCPALSALTFMFFGFLVAGELLTGSVRERVWAPSLDPWKYYVSVGVLTIFALLILFGGLQFARTLVSGMLVNRSVTIYNSTQNIENASRSVNTALKVLPANDRAHRAAIELGLLQLKQLIVS